MIILAEGAPASFEKRYKDNPHVGHLLTPRSLNVQQVLESGLPWGVDCDSVRGFEEDRFYRLLERLLGQGACKFCAIPPRATMARIAMHAIPPAPVITPGGARWETCSFWWNRVRGIVLAGDAKWRQGNQDVANLIKEARGYGKWVHARDVCSYRQARSMAKMGVNSCSLPHYGRFNYERFEPVLNAAMANSEPSLFGGT